MPAPVAKLHLPELEQVKLNGFSLYAYNSNATVDLVAGATCIVGANGLGKSTFLSAVVFGLTGHLPHPDKEFQSLAKYLEDSAKFPEHYFSGRIQGSDRPSATVSLNLTIRNKHYQLERGIFDPSSLVSLSIIEYEDDWGIDLASDVLPEELRTFYESQLIEDVGLHTFDQFIFLQQELLTFDERRILLFWDERLMEQTLYLVFGLNPSLADRATHLRKEAERQGSLGRNVQWQATQTRSVLKTLARKSDSLAEAQIDQQTFEEYEAVLDAQSELRTQLSKLSESIRDHQASISNLIAKQIDLKDAYESEFSLVFERKDVWRNPTVARLVAEGECLACGSISPEIRQVAMVAKDTNQCPICRSKVVSETPSDEAIAKLSNIDADVGRIQKEIRDTRAEIERLKSQTIKTENELEVLRQKQRDIEKDNKAIGEFGNIDTEILDLRRRSEGLQLTLDSLTKKRNDHYAARDTCMAELQVLQAQLVESFRSTEEQFIPVFRSLAESFIGRSVSVRLEQRPLNRSIIIMDLEGETRRDNYQLSESQKYFIDIALRMALIRTMSAGASRPCFLVDTPEGSLDIAYESRAGHMFSVFAEDCDVLMTANLNSSYLLVRLAEECKHQRMKVERMTDWAALSDVQQAESGLFDEAFTVIEAALGGSAEA